MLASTGHLSQYHSLSTMMMMKTRAYDRSNMIEKHWIDAQFSFIPILFFSFNFLEICKEKGQKKKRERK